MKTARYGKIDKDIIAHDGGGIWERWRYGRLLLVDDTATTPAGNLQHGVLAQLITAAERHGIKVSEREIQRRVQCAKTYPTEAQIRHVVTDFETWHDVVNSGWPEYPAPEDERPYDPRSDAELTHDHNRTGRNLFDGEGNRKSTLFDSFEPASTTLAELARWTDEQEEITARFVAIGIERRRYLDALIKVVHGDMTATWAAAQAALDEEDPSGDEDDETIG